MRLVLWIRGLTAPVGDSAETQNGREKVKWEGKVERSLDN